MKSKILFAIVFIAAACTALFSQSQIGGVIYVPGSTTSVSGSGTNGDPAFYGTNLNVVTLGSSGTQTIYGTNAFYRVNVTGTLTLADSDLISNVVYSISVSNQSSTVNYPSTWRWIDGPTLTTGPTLQNGQFELGIRKDSNGTNAWRLVGRNFTMDVATNGISLATNSTAASITISNTIAAPSALVAGSSFLDVRNYFRQNGRSIIEEFNGDSEADDKYGDFHWSRVGNTGTAIWTNFGPKGVVGVLAISPRDAASGKGYGMFQGGGSAKPTILLTNAEFFVLYRLMTSMLDTATDTNVTRSGFAPTSALGEQNSYCGFLNTNNNFVFVTSRSASRTVTSTGSNWTANVWYQAAWRLDSTGTNVYAYVGPNDDNMACVATNSSNIPHDIPLLPMLHCVRGLTNSTAGVTNFWDRLEIRIR